MKTYKHLYPRLCEFENLYSAFLRARKGKRSRPDVAAFEDNLEAELPALQAELLDESYQPGPYRHFTIYEGKPRRISAAPFRDRVVHHALCGVIEPIWEARGRWAARHQDLTGFGNLSGLNEALTYAVEGGYRIYEADARVALAWAHLAEALRQAQGDGLRQARQEAERAQQMSAQMGYHWGQVDAAEALAALASANGVSG